MASLPEASGYRAMWLETTKSAHHHGGAGWEFGTCLWSPSLNKSGARYYNVMKEPRRGDLVLHNYHYVPDQASPAAHYLCATSIVLRPAKITTSEPPSAGDWTGRKEYFRIELEGFQWLDTRLSIAMFVEYYEEQLRNELLLHYSRFFPFTINANQVRLGQGMYLARVTPALFALFTDALGIEKAQTPVVPDTTDAHRQYAEGERQRREQFAFLRNPALARDAKERDYLHLCGVSLLARAELWCGTSRCVFGVSSSDPIGRTQRSSTKTQHTRRCSDRVRELSSVVAFSERGALTCRSTKVSRAARLGAPLMRGTMDIAKAQKRLLEFTAQREWDQFHSPKNLAMALTAEAGELAEVFQWMTELQSRELENSSPDLGHASEEIADVMIYLLRLAELLRIDLEEAVNDKIDVNAAKYPVNVSKGKATKYNRRR